MRIGLAGLLILAMIFVSCSKVEERPIVVSTDVWIGSAPLYYAHAKGWLREANIEMLLVPSINENLHLYENKASDVVTGTQHEFKRLKKRTIDLMPIIVHDQSVGGDVILSNHQTQAIVDSKRKINVYLEEDTVGEDMLDYFLKEYRIGKERIVLHNRPQEEVMTMIPSADDIEIVVTYNPHEVVLKKNGFIEVASSRKPAYLVLDGFYVSEEFYDAHQEQLAHMYAAFERAKKAYQKDPKEFYKTTKMYLGNPSYYEFKRMLGNIKWLDNAALDKSMIQQMEEIGVPTHALIGRKQQ